MTERILIVDDDTDALEVYDVNSGTFQMCTANITQAVAVNPVLLGTWGGEWLLALPLVAGALLAYRRERLLAMAVLARLCGHSWAASWLLLALAVTWFAPTISDFRVANVNRLQLGLLALHLWVSARARLRGRHVCAGVVLGLAVTITLLKGLAAHA